MIQSMIIIIIIIIAVYRPPSSEGLASLALKTSLDSEVWIAKAVFLNIWLDIPSGPEADFERTSLNFKRHHLENR